MDQLRDTLRREMQHIEPVGLDADRIRIESGLCQGSL